MASCPCCRPASRRNLLRGAAWLAAASLATSAGPERAFAAPRALDREARDRLTPDQVVEMMKEGNARFRGNQAYRHDYLSQKRATVAGQFPAAFILSCIDSRAPAEIIFDMALGDAFNARIAGNIVNPDILGSMEFACAVAGAKVVLVMGHTGCGAVRGAIDGAELGNLTGLLDRIKPSVAATRFEGERAGGNPAFVNAVAQTNVRRAMNAVRQGSPTLADLERDGRIKNVGSMYRLDGGKVDFLA